MVEEWEQLRTWVDWKFLSLPLTDEVTKGEEALQLSAWVRGGEFMHKPLEVQSGTTENHSSVHLLSHL